jgi:hypothetical protein
MKVIPPGTSLNQVKFNELANIQTTGSLKPDIDGLMENKVTGGKRKTRKSKKSKGKKKHGRKTRKAY